MTETATANVPPAAPTPTPTPTTRADAMRVAIVVAIFALALNGAFYVLSASYYDAKGVVDPSQGLSVEAALHGSEDRVQRLRRGIIG